MVNKYGFEVTKGILFGDPVMIAEMPGSNFAFIWHGGAYIDEIRKSFIDGTFIMNDEWWTYSDQNINIWDYEKGSASIKFNDNDALITVLTEWMDA